MMLLSGRMKSVGSHSIVDLSSAVIWFIDRGRREYYSVLNLEEILFLTPHHLLDPRMRYSIAFRYDISYCIEEWLSHVKNISKLTTIKKKNHKLITEFSNQNSNNVVHHIVHLPGTNEPYRILLLEIDSGI